MEVFFRPDCRAAMGLDLTNIRPCATICKYIPRVCVMFHAPAHTSPSAAVESRA
jgi:hypothetical protein